MLISALHVLAWLAGRHTLRCRFSYGAVLHACVVARKPKQLKRYFDLLLREDIPLHPYLVNQLRRGLGTHSFDQYCQQNGLLEFARWTTS